MYDSDGGIEEMVRRLAAENDEPTGIDVEWLADQMRLFVDLHPDWEQAIGRLAVQIARADD